MTQPTPDREREALLEWLGDQRSHVLGVLNGLSEEKLRQPVLPSGWSCLALVRHLAVDDERFWFRAVAAGEALDLNDDTGWQPSPDEPAGAVLDLYRQETAASDVVLAGSAWMRRRPDGRTTSAAGGSATCGRSSCTSSPRPQSMPGTSTRHANCLTAAPGWARRTRGSRATERAAPSTREHRRHPARLSGPRPVPDSTEGMRRVRHADPPSAIRRNSTVRAVRVGLLVARPTPRGGAAFPLGPWRPVTQRCRMETAGKGQPGHGYRNGSAWACVEWLIMGRNNGVFVGVGTGTVV